MATTEAIPKVATSSNHAALRKTVFLLLRMAIGIAILVYLAKSGQINFASLIRLLHAWPLTLTAVLFLLLDILLMSIRASLLFRTARLSLSLANSVQLNLIGFLFSTLNSLPLTPGGIGIGETAFTALFRLTGINGGAETLLCVRLWNVLVGLLGLLVYLFGMQRSVYPYAEEVGGAEAGYIGAESTN
jgi:hypothetical protein